MIGIIGAMDIEIKLILEEMKNIKELKYGIRTFYEGQLNNREVVVVLAGIGKVNAAITTSLLLTKYPIQYLINVGVAGGQNGVNHKDVVISSEVVYHDVDVARFGKYLHGQIPGSEPLFYADKKLLEATEKVLKKLDLRHKIGKIASGDQFVYEKEKIKEVNKLYTDIYAVEMEAAAIAHTATEYHVPFIIYRSISDVLDDESQADDFYEFLDEAAHNAARVLLELVKEL